MRTLVKLGGTLLDLPQSRARISLELAEFMKLHVDTVVVHGGGKQMSRYLSERGVESRFVNGLRVSTPEVIDAVLKVFAGTVNHELVAALVAAGVNAVGLSGIDSALVEATPLGGEYGAVGKPVHTNPKLFSVLCEAGFLPVVACIAGDRQGNIFNVNADQMAVACATGFAADQLCFLTDVDGVRRADGSFARQLDIAEMDDLIRSGVATGGMQAKLEAARLALVSGVREVIIAPGTCPKILERLYRQDSVGTRLIS